MGWVWPLNTSCYTEGVERLLKRITEQQSNRAIKTDSHFGLRESRRTDDSDSCLGARATATPLHLQLTLQHRELLSTVEGTQPFALTTVHDSSLWDIVPHTTGQNVKNVNDGHFWQVGARLYKWWPSDLYVHSSQNSQRSCGNNFA